MTPFQKFLSGLKAAREEVGETLDELTAFAEIMARKQNCIELDDNGFFYVTAAGPLDEVIPTVHKLLDKLERIKKEKDSAV